MSGGFLEGVWKVSGGCVKGTWKVLGRFGRYSKGFWRVFGMCRNVTGKSREVSEEYLGSV